MPSEFFLNPLELFVLALLAAMALVRWWPALDVMSPRGRPILVASGVFIGGYVLIVIYYVWSPGVYDHGEIMVPAWAWMYATGHPLYNKIADAARYSTLYGPDGTIFFAWAMQLLGPSLFTCKLLAGFSGVASACLAFAAYAKQWDVKRAWFGTGVVCLFFLAFAFQTFMTKADPFLMVFASLALWAVVATGPMTAGILIALSLGLEVNLKIHAFLYLLPILVIYWRRTDFKHTAIVCAGAFVVFILPFFAPQISFSDWQESLRLEGGEGIGFPETMANVDWFAFLWIPFAALFFICSRRNPTAFAAIYARHRLFIFVLFVSILLTGIVGSKVASGPAQFTTFIPLLVYAFCLFLDKEMFTTKTELKLPDRAAQACLAAFCAAALFLAGHQQLRFLTTLSMVNANTELVDADVDSIIKALPGKTISMGYGSNQNFFLSQQFLPLVFANNPLYFEFSAMQGFHDDALSEAGREVIAKKLVNVWLIPKDDQPFVIRSFYRPNPPLFDDAFRASFDANYQRVGSSRFFDIYQPKP